MISETNICIYLIGIKILLNNNNSERIIKKRTLEIHVFGTDR